MDFNYLIQLYHLTDTERCILNYLRDQKENLDKLNVRKTAQACYTSPSTVINLAKKLQLSGFSELIFQMKHGNLQDKTYTNLSEEKIASFCKLIDERGEKTVALIGSGFSLHLAHYMNEVFNVNGIPSIVTSHSQVFQLRSPVKFLPIFISHSGEEKELVSMAKKCLSKNISCISFTGNQTSSLAKISTLTFSSNTFSPFSVAVAKPQFFFGDTLNHFEIIISQYLNQKKA